MSTKPNSSSLLRCLLLLIATLGFAGSLSGCHLYFTDDDDGYEEECWWEGCGYPESSGYPDAGPGWECQSNDQCAAGCYCSNGWCEETGFCDAYTTCSSDMVCDDRGTCIPTAEPEPEPEPTLTCQSTVFCDAAAPICPVGSTPVIENGCYNGQCMAKEDCPDGAPFACSDLNASEDSCVASPLCEPIYKGVNCTSDTGAACTAGAANCSCETFELDRCDEIDAP